MILTGGGFGITEKERNRFFKLELKKNKRQLIMAKMHALQT